MRRSETPNPQTAFIDLAIDLDFTALAQALPDILAHGEHESLSYVEFSLALLVAESAGRQDRSGPQLLAR